MNLKKLGKFIAAGSLGLGLLVALGYIVINCFNRLDQALIEEAVSVSMNGVTYPVTAIHLVVAIFVAGFLFSSDSKSSERCSKCVTEKKKQDKKSPTLMM